MVGGGGGGEQKKSKKKKTKKRAKKTKKGQSAVFLEGDFWIFFLDFFPIFSQKRDEKTISRSL